MLVFPDIVLHLAATVAKLLAHVHLNNGRFAAVEAALATVTMIWRCVFGSATTVYGLQEWREGTCAVAPLAGGMEAQQEAGSIACWSEPGATCLRVQLSFKTLAWCRQPR